MRDFYG